MRRIKYRGSNIGKIVADLVATLADNEKIEIVRESNINDNTRDTVQIVIWSRNATDGFANSILDCYETVVPRQSFD